MQLDTNFIFSILTVGLLILSTFAKRGEAESKQQNAITDAWLQDRDTIKSLNKRLDDMQADINKLNEKVATLEQERDHALGVANAKDVIIAAKDKLIGERAAEIIRLKSENETLRAAISGSPPPAVPAPTAVTPPPSDNAVASG